MRTRIKHTLWHAAAALAGAVAGALTALALAHLPAAASATVPAWLLVPFLGLLWCIAIVPQFHPHLWERHYAGFSLALGAFTVAVYAALYGAAGSPAIGHTAVEYMQFMALVGGLFVVSGGILIDVRRPGRPLVNTLLLGAGALLANAVGTTGASMLLIRPFLRINRGRIRPFHIAFFIMIVSNCGGCLTPLGDPPLFLGYLKGVPFTWTFTHLWPYWLLVNGLLLALFWIFDRRTQATGDALPAAAGPAVTVAGWRNVALLVLFLGALMADAPLRKATGWHGVPFGAVLQLAIALLSLRTARRDILAANEFTLRPVREVGFLFAGIFATMIPALEFLQQNAGSFGIESPRGFFYACGGLSAVLDNAPTYLSFLQAALGATGAADPAALLATAHGNALLAAVSAGAVFFGAMTYIGNGPNFMVKAVAEAAHVRTPTFLGYMGWSLLVLLPVLALAFRLLGGG